MPPAARLSLISKLRMSPVIGSAPTRFRVQGWDPVLIISQIVSLQALHYLSLSLLLPPLLHLFASPVHLSLEGGATSLSPIMDWRSFLGQSTVSLSSSLSAGRGDAFVGLSQLGRKMGEVVMSVGERDLSNGLIRVVGSDSARGWVVAFAWVCASMIDVFYLYHLIRRPTHILDSSLTLLFNHLLLTTYYSSHFPTSLFLYIVLITSSIAQIVLAEQWCVRREMREGFVLDGSGSSGSASGGRGGRSGSPSGPGVGRKEDLEMGHVRGGGGGSKQYEKIAGEDFRTD